MKRYLLAWYGITDLRAAFGVGELGGPVLGALRTGDFTDATVLAYTDPGKSGEDLEGRQREMTKLMGRARKGFRGADFRHSRQL
jgi:hypothetical protein